MIAFQFFISYFVDSIYNFASSLIDVLAIQQKSLDRALFLYIFIREARLSGVRASITIVTFENSTKCSKVLLD